MTTATKKKAAAPTNTERMEQAIELGGSVLYNGELITDVDDLPTDEELGLTAEDSQTSDAGTDAEGAAPGRITVGKRGGRKTIAEQIADGEKEEVE